MKLTESTQRELTDAILQRDRDVNMFIEKLRNRANNLKLKVKPDEETVESEMKGAEQDVKGTKLIDLDKLFVSIGESAAFDCYSMARQLRIVGYGDDVIKSSVFEFWLNRKPSYVER